MKYAKMLGLLAVAAAAMMAFAGSASATTATSPAGVTYTGKITAVANVKEEGHVTLHNALGKVSCDSTVEGTIEKHGSAVTLEGKISKLTFTNCTEGYVVHVKSGGTLIAHTDTHATVDGILTSTGATVEITSPAGVTCSYTTNATSLGTLTGSSTTGGHATLDISATITRHAGSFFCGSTGNWTGSYTVVTPSFLNID